jgi:hypothetical protein
LESKSLRATHLAKVTNYQWFSLGLGIIFISIGISELVASTTRPVGTQLGLSGWFVAGVGSVLRFLDGPLGSNGAQLDKVGTCMLLVGLGLLVISSVSS